MSDMAVIASIGVVSYGVWMIYPPASFIVGGMISLTLSLAVAAKGPAR